MHVVWNINELHEILFMVLKPLNLQSYKIEKPPKNEEWRMLFSEQHSNDNIVRKRVRWATETHWPWKHHLRQNVNVYCQHGPDVVVET